jgi:putative endonuclease
MINQQTGQLGEALAAEYLVKQGFVILERNWRFKQWEVDIIASKAGLLHFVEVKTRTSHRFGKPEESITREKMKHMRNVAEEYQYKHPEWKYIQFDVLAITLVNEEAKEIFMINDVYF